MKPEITTLPNPSWIRRIFAFGFFVALSTSLTAQSGAGRITGRVIDNSNDNGLKGAYVYIEGTSYNATTNAAGVYYLNNVPSGTYQVSASYLGVGESTQSVTVTANGTATSNFSLGDEVFELEGLVVSSVYQGQEAAINRQRTSDTITNVIAADVIGSLPDRTVGEALRRLPGVAVLTDRGEAVNIAIRGASPDWNSITLNGDRIPAESGFNGQGGRRASTDAVPSNLISEIEVTKAILPNMEADSIGGNINLKTKNPFELDGPIFNARAQYGYSELRGSGSYGYNIDLGGVTEDGQWGYLFSLSYEDRKTSVDNPTIDYENNPVDQLWDPALGRVVDVTPFRAMEELQERFRYIDRERIGINSQINYKLSEKTTLFGRAFYSEFNDRETRWRNRLENDRGDIEDPVTGDEATYWIGSDINNSIGIEGRSRMRVRNGGKDSLLQQYTVGFNTVGDKLKIDGSIGINQNEFEQRRTRSEWRQNDIEFLTLARENQLRVPQFNAPNDPDFLENLDAFELDSANIDDVDDSEEEMTIQLDFTYYSQIGDDPIEWKFGYKGRLKDKVVERSIRPYDYEGPDLTLADPSVETRVVPQMRFTKLAGLTFGPWVDQDHFEANIFRPNTNNPDIFELDLGDFIEDNANVNYDYTEDIHALYFMGDYTKNKFNFSAGFRYEETRNDYVTLALSETDVDNLADDLESGALNTDTFFDEIRGPNSEFRVADSGTYGELFPAAVGTYRFTPNMLLRVAVTSSILRPDYLELLPYTNIENDVDDNNTEDNLLDDVLEAQFITRGNPNLDPTTSTNFDISIERYFGKAGLFTISAFHKELEDYVAFRNVERIGTATWRDEEGNSRTTNNVEINENTPVNFGKGHLQGIEFNFSKKFTELPGAFDGLGVAANFAFMSSELEDPVTGQVFNYLPFQADYVYNAQLFYEKFGFSGRVAASWNGAQPNSLGGTGVWRTNDDTQIDAQLNYAINENWEVFVQARTLWEEGREQFEDSDPNFIVEREQTGDMYWFGVSYSR